MDKTKESENLNKTIRLAIATFCLLLTFFIVNQSIWQGFVPVLVYMFSGIVIATTILLGDWEKKE